MNKMTEPSQYFKGRTVQEQMDEVIGYVDKRAEEVAAAKADAVLQPAEQAKTAAQAAAEAAEAAKDVTIAALPEIRQDISGLKAEDTALDGRLDTVELKVTTAEGNIVTIQGQITAIENKNTQQDSAITALQTADRQNVKINNVNQYAVGLTGNQGPIAGLKNFNDLTQRIYQSNTHTIQTEDLSGGEYSSQLVATSSSSIDINLFFMWHNTRKGISPQVSQCGFVSAGFRPQSIQIASIAGTSPMNNFAITRRVVDGQNEYRLWSTGQIKTIDIMFESVGYNNIKIWNKDDSPIKSSDLSTYDEVKYL